MPPPCHSANTPGASGEAATSNCVKGRLLLVIDMAPPPIDAFYAGTSGVDERGTYMSNHFDRRERRFAFSGLTAHWQRHGGCRHCLMEKNLRKAGPPCR